MPIIAIIDGIFTNVSSWTLNAAFSDIGAMPSPTVQILDYMRKNEGKKEEEKKLSVRFNNSQNTERAHSFTSDSDIHEAS